MLRFDWHMLPTYKSAPPFKQISDEEGSLGRELPLHTLG